MGQPSYNGNPIDKVIMDKAVVKINKMREETGLPYFEKDLIKKYNELLADIPYFNRSYSFLPIDERKE